MLALDNDLWVDLAGNHRDGRQVAALLRQAATGADLDIWFVTCSGTGSPVHS